MHRNHISYYVYLFFTMALFGFAFYQYKSQPPINTVQEAIALLIPFQYEPMILILSLFFCVLNSIAFLWVSFKRAWFMLFDREIIHGIFSLILAISMSFAIYYFGVSAYLKFTGVALIVVIMFINAVTEDDKPKKRKYRRYSY
ncbi:hypothetical protein [Neobacillus niacini]|uniref:hypothetical protein n=1 Tax=Neobacillus niacini TaxID=86668 RepID=UPI0021CB7DF8|nr:hypothetical protein [Neobacillus niacini]MCM3764615.1 hypothetical protein [Neobacillus niacini]